MPLLNDKQFQMRVAPEFLARLDSWRREQADLPGRSEAIRRLVEIGFASKALRGEESVDQTLKNL